MTNAQYQRWKGYMSKGMMPPPYLDTIVHNAMQDASYESDGVAEYQAFRLTLNDIDPEETKLSEIPCMGCGKHYEVKKRDEALFLYEVEHCMICWVAVCSNCRETSDA